MRFNQEGFSVLETLVAMGLASMLCISLIKYQLHLIYQLNSIHYQQLALQAQISLSERLKTCLSNHACQKREHHRWKNEVEAALPECSYDYVLSEKSLVSTLYWNHKKERMTFRFYHV